jgi:coenzyme PQQ precursor peptide PqqA
VKLASAVRASYCLVSQPCVGIVGFKQKEEILMAWKSPKIVEIALGCEINCYACADIKA